jgi:hypothetical protein
MVEVFKKEFWLAGELAEREGATIHEPLDDTREETSHQFRSFLRI